MSHIPSSEARKGEVVSTINSLDGVGIGYLVGSVVYRTTGSYWAIDAREDAFPMVEYRRDGGTLYQEHVNALMLPPAYKG